jgi:predicted phosphoadenosine phosphosulfate sulfurtransferase
MVSRVNGVSFAGMYGNTVAMGWRSISCPDGFTWKEYMYFLLDTLPRATRENYLEKLRVSQKFWREKGGCLGEETIGKLRAAGVPFTVEECTTYRTDKRPVRMEYIDEIDIPEFREIPTYKRMCVCILKNDHTCKYMGFTQTKREREMKERVLKRYKL